MKNQIIEENNQYYPTANRNVKDRLFRFVFNTKEDLLNLYNAVNESNYTNLDDLEINTIEEAVYLSMKNDISFLIGGTLNLYEHQSTYNPNMPMRGLIYLAKLYERYINSGKINIYREQLQKFPIPKYIVFYNGLKDEPDRIELNLSDAFKGMGKEEPCLECRAIMLNINYGHNKDLMERCRKLEEYSIFIATVRKYEEIYDDLTWAVNMAIEDCINNNILREVLMNSKSEVASMVLTTFDREVYERDLREDAYGEGYILGAVQMFIEMNQTHNLSTKEAVLKEIMHKFSLDKSDAEKYMKEYWKQEG